MKEITEDKGRIRPVVEGDFQCDENGNSTRFYEILSIVGIVDNTTKLSYISKKNVPVGIPITNEEYWYPFQVIAVPKGDKGDDGKSAYDLYIEHGGTIATVEEWLESLHGADGISPILRISPDGLSIEISSDNGQTWLPFQKDFNKLRVLGYVDSIAELPASANIGDIYGVWNQQAQSGAGAYELYINTVKDWLLDYTITKVYDYDTELPSSATDGTAVLVPVTDLTLDKEKIDGYKVYRYSLTNNGWIMILNTAEIYANKTDIINYGDNIYALVHGATEGTYELYKRSVGWVQFGTNASITYHLIQNISDATSTNVLSGKAVKDAIEEEATTREEAVSEINQTIDNYKEEVKETYGDYIENPEFVRVATDDDDKVLYGVQKDGNFYFGAGCPQQVKDYVQQQIDTIIGVSDVTEKIDTINEMIAFFDEISHDTTLKELLAASAQAVAEEKTRAEAAEQHLADVKANKEEVNAALDTKVDKEEGKSLIDAEYASTKSTVDNPEFLEVTTDSEDKVLEGIQQDGTKVIGGDINVGGSANISGDIEVRGNIEISGVSYKVIENQEYLAAWLDTEDKVIFGFKADGKTYVGDADFLNEIKNNKEAISELKAVLGNISSSIESLDIDALSSITAIESPEYLNVELDAEDKVLSGTKVDGSHYAYNMHSETIDAKVDKEDGKSLIAEEVSESLSAIEDPEGRSEITLDSEGKIISYRKPDGTKVENAGFETTHINGVSVDNILKSNYNVREYNLPKYGNVNISKEIAFTDGTNSYAPNKVSKVGDKYYVKSSLVDGQVTEDSIEVTIVESDIDISLWPEDKNIKHYCKVDIDFGSYLKGTYYVEVKFQGSSSMRYPKKNFRFTFYKDVVFSKKLKFKIGELIETSKYNLKAYWIDKSLMREPACYRIIQAIRETREYNQQYPWNKNYNIFTGATGLTLNFPIRIDVSRDFYGIHWFGLAKDINNFMLDDETMNGILVQGASGNDVPDFWQRLDTTRWDDILGDTDNEIGQDSLPSFQAFYDYINSGEGFNRTTAPQHMDIKDWIDCIIILELFCCRDSLAQNCMLYTGEDKQIYHPMYYDMDYTFTYSSPNFSVYDTAIAVDRSIWVNFMNLYWNEICDRYKELRTTVITKEYMAQLLQNLIRNISYKDYKEEMTKWEDHGVGTLNDNINWINQRIDWMDSVYKNK